MSKRPFSEADSKEEFYKEIEDKHLTDEQKIQSQAREEGFIGGARQGGQKDRETERKLGLEYKKYTVNGVTVEAGWSEKDKAEVVYFPDLDKKISVIPPKKEDIANEFDVPREATASEVMKTLLEICGRFPELNSAEKIYDKAQSIMSSGGSGW